MKKYNSPKYDTINSTYIIITVFESGNEMIGYSCRKGFTEPKSKETCLLNIFIRLYQQGYFRLGQFFTKNGNPIEPVERMEFYSRETNELVFTFYPSYYEPVFTHGWTLKFLQKIDDMFQDINQGISVSALYDKYYVGRVRPQRPTYDLSAPRFFSQAALNQYARKLLQDGEAPGLVEGFVKSYANKFFENGVLSPEVMKSQQTDKLFKDHARACNTPDPKIKQGNRQGAAARAPIDESKRSSQTQVLGNIVHGAIAGKTKN